MSKAGLAMAFATAIAFSAAQAQPVDWQQSKPIDITLSNFRFTPATLELQHGIVYRLHIVNSANGGHNFAAPEFFAAAQIDPEDAGKLKNGKVDFAAGQTVEIRVVPGAPATYPLRCTHFLHSGFGMTGQIIVH